MAKPSQPLSGKRIVVTRAPDQSVEFVDQLKARGAEVLLLPLVLFCEPEDLAPLDEAIRQLDRFDWVVFTSRNAVKFLASRFKTLQISAEHLNRLLSKPQVATIGSATSDEAWSVGFLPKYEAEKSTGERLALDLQHQLRRKRVLLPRSDIANSPLPQILRQAGADVVEVIAYRTVGPKSVDTAVVEAIRLGNVDVITLFSPSAYHHLVEEIELGVLRAHLGNALRRDSGKIVLATIGPTTSSAVRADGLKVCIEAPNASARALCEAIVRYFEDRDSEALTE